jgi:hypothetical protein
VNITRDLIKSLGHQINGAWNAEQLALVGIAWPAPKGWKELIVGREVTQETIQRIAASRATSVEREIATARRHAVMKEEIYYTWPDGKGSFEGSWTKPKDWF